MTRVTSGTRNGRTRRGFTIVELLVVVSIIILLVALTMPAADRAMFSAMSTTCGAQHRQIGQGLFTYASDNMQFYPYRGPRYNNGTKVHALPFWWSAGSAWDLHTVAEDYFNGGKPGLPPILVCKVAPDAIWHRDLAQNWPLAGIYRTNVNVWAGWDWKNVASSAYLPASPAVDEDQMPLKMSQSGASRRPVSGDTIEYLTGDSYDNFSGYMTPHAYNRKYHFRVNNGPEEPPADGVPFCLSDGSVIFTSHLEAVFRDTGYGTKFWADPNE
ncbi:MAG: hypothetical protein GC159_06050 [Phycisphaera sp.]|nr:hypothetical protein [Phycisphaera sp.]